MVIVPTVLARGRVLVVLPLIAFALASSDLILRGRTAYLEGEKYMRWHAEPRLQAEFYKAAFEREKAQIEESRMGGLMDEAEAKQRIELLAVERDERIAEEPLKYATHWFKTASHLFSPPNTRWIARAIQREKEARALWRQKLKASGQRFEERWLE